MSEENESDQFDQLLQQFGIAAGEQDRAIIPSEGVSFGAGSFIAQWTAGIYYWFLTNTDYVTFNNDADSAEEKVSAPQIRRSKGDSGYFDMYYLDYAQALDAYYKLEPVAKEEKYKPTTYWVFTAPTTTVMNSKDLNKVIEGFGEQIVVTVRVMALRKGSARYPLKERHEFGLFSLPGAVAAAADAFGFSHVGFDLSEFTQPDAKDQFNDEFFKQFCGDVEGDYEESVLYQRRAALWKSLGEENPKASAMIGSKTATGKPNRQATSSPQLSACLGIAQGRWTKPIYARVMLVPNPMAAKNGEYYSIPVLGEMFKSESEARAAALADLGTDAEAGEDCPPKGGWGSTPTADIVAYLRDNNILWLDGKEPPPPARAKLIEDSYLESWENVVAWNEYAKKG